MIVIYVLECPPPPVDDFYTEKWWTFPFSICVACDRSVKIMHRHHCRICGGGYFCDLCAPKRSFTDRVTHRIIFERACPDCAVLYGNV